MLSAIVERRSVRRYKSASVPKEVIEEILQAGILAPSAKNRQPWKFIVVADSAKTEMLAAMEKGLKREKTAPLLPKSAQHVSGAEHTLQIMRQAPVIIFVVNLLGTDIRRPLEPEERIYEICNIQSIGAALENMTLAATALGLGSLWICDIFFAYEELKDWLNAGGEPVAALAVGYADEAPFARPRKGMDAAAEWRT